MSVAGYLAGKWDSFRRHLMRLRIITSNDIEHDNARREFMPKPSHSEKVDNSIVVAHGDGGSMGNKRA